LEDETMGIGARFKAIATKAKTYIVQRVTPTGREELKKQRERDILIDREIAAQKAFADRILSTKTPQFKIEMATQNPTKFKNGVIGRAREAGASPEKLAKMQKMDPLRLDMLYQVMPDLFEWYFAYDDDRESYTREEEIERKADKVISSYEEMHGPLK
jgi:hypothetical protein